MLALASPPVSGWHGRSSFWLDDLQLEGTRARRDARRLSRQHGSDRHATDAGDGPRSPNMESPPVERRPGAGPRLQAAHLAIDELRGPPPVDPSVLATKRWRDGRGLVVLRDGGEVAIGPARQLYGPPAAPVDAAARGSSRDPPPELATGPRWGLHRAPESSPSGSRRRPGHPPGSWPPPGRRPDVAAAARGER